MPDDKKKSQYSLAYKQRKDEGLVTPKVQSLPYGERGEESPGTKLGLKIAPGPHDRMTKNPFEEEGFSHLQSHETKI